MKRLLVLPVLALALVGCSGTDAESGNSTTGDQFTGVKTVTYNGEALHCVTYSHGITCDWVRYHKENGF